MPDPGTYARIDARRARRRFERAAASYRGACHLESEIESRMLERLDYIKLAPRRILDAGSGPPRALFRKRYPKAEAISLDFSLAMLRAGSGWTDFFRKKTLLCADTARLPIASGALDLAWSNMVLHWVADPLAAFRELHRVLKVEGLLMFSTLGPDTLAELRAAAGMERVHAFTDMHDLGDMLVAAGFSAPVMDMERLTLQYASGAALLADLRASGQTCALSAAARGLAGRGFLESLKRGLAARARDGKLAVGYEVVYGHAWKAAPTRTADGRSVVKFS